VRRARDPATRSSKLGEIAVNEQTGWIAALGRQEIMPKARKVIDEVNARRRAPP
jgi:hypothetical protein